MASSSLVQLPHSIPLTPPSPSSSPLTSNFTPTPSSSPPNFPSPTTHPPNPQNDNALSWPSTIARLAHRGRLRDAAATFTLMLSCTSPPLLNHTALLSLLSACADLSSSSPSLSLSLGLSLHSLLLKHYPLSLSSDDRTLLLLNTALLDFYANCGRPHSARQLFDRMPTKNSFSYNALIAGHMRSAQVDLALSVFDQMPSKARDAVSWTALIDGLIKNGLLEEALQHFQQLQLQRRYPIKPDYVMMIPLVTACAELGALGHGMWVHRYAMNLGLCSETRLANSLIDMYSRCGRVDLALQVFNQMHHKKRTRVTWNSIIVGFAINGRCHEALRHFETMQRLGFEPDGVSFTGALTACSHAGLVDEGMKYYKLMRDKYGEIPMRVEHYGCMVDLLGRAGRLKEAMGVVESMRPVMGPNEVILGSLLAACRVHTDVCLAEKLMGYLIELEPESDSNFVLMSNMYAAVGKWAGVGKMRNLMKSLGVKKGAGYSAVEIDGDFHEFVAGDKGHMQSDDIYDMLHLLCFEMKLHHQNDAAIDPIERK